MQQEPVPEFSHIIALDQIGASGAHYQIDAKAEECVLLAKRFGIVAIPRLNAGFTLKPAEGPGNYFVEGNLKAKVVQLCVSTSAEVAADVNLSFQMFLCPSTAENKTREYEIEWEEETDTEYYTTAVIDLGETAAQYLYINLDPYPRAPDAPVADQAEKESAKGEINPFVQALKGLAKGP